MSTRQASTKEFNSGGGHVYPLTTEAGGLGLNLPDANYRLRCRISDKIIEQVDFIRSIQFTENFESDQDDILTLDEEREAEIIYEEEMGRRRGKLDDFAHKSYTNYRRETESWAGGIPSAAGNSAGPLPVLLSHASAPLEASLKPPWGASMPPRGPIRASLLTGFPALPSTPIPAPPAISGAPPASFSLPRAPSAAPSTLRCAHISAPPAIPRAVAPASPAFSTARPGLPRPLPSTTTPLSRKLPASPAPHVASHKPRAYSGSNASGSHTPSGASPRPPSVARASAVCNALESIRTSSPTHLRTALRSVAQVESRIGTLARTIPNPPWASSKAPTLPQLRLLNLLAR
ncbi:hypothetical protein RUND412_001225 [Rhizina undulata]